VKEVKQVHKKALKSPMNDHMNPKNCFSIFSHIYFCQVFQKVLHFQFRMIFLVKISKIHVENLIKIPYPN
jgi:hypothetical protein